MFVMFKTMETVSPLKGFDIRTRLEVFSFVMLDTKIKSLGSIHNGGENWHTLYSIYQAASSVCVNGTAVKFEVGHKVAIVC